MLLTCPTCRSGLEVPDDTDAAANVRCPACKTVFSAAVGTAPEPEAEDDEPAPRRKPVRNLPDDTADEDERRKPRKRRPADDDEEDDERPRTRKKPAKAKDAEEETKNRDFDPDDPDEERKRRKRRRDEDDSGMTVAEKTALRNAFTRAAWGSKLVWMSLSLFMMSMTCIILFWFQTAFSDPNPAFIVGAGVIGAAGWVLAAVGVGLCLSGPVSPGHWGYGTAAAVATGLHLILLLALASKGTDYSAGRSPNMDPNDPAVNWGLVPTRLDALTFYLTYAVYKDQELVPKGEMTFSIVVGVLEVVRTTLIMMLLSCLARAAGDEELSHRCTRAAGMASFGPGFMAAGMFAFAVLMTESRAGTSNFTTIIFTTIVMGTYAIVNACIMPGFLAARDVQAACEEPFQSQLPKI